MITQPDRVVFPALGVTKLDLVRYYLAVADGALRGVARPADGAQALRQGHRRGGRSSRSARRRSGRRLRRRRRAALRLRHVGRGGRGPRRRRAGLGRQPRLHRPQPAPGARGRPRPPRRAADRPRPGARGRLGADRRGRPRRPRGARGRTASSAWPKTSGVARLPRLRPDRAGSGRSRRCGSRPRRSPARSSAARRTSRPRRWWKEERHGRLRRLQPERQGPHRRLGLLGARRRPTPGSRRRWPGTRCRAAGPEAFTLARRARALSPRRGDPWAGIDDRGRVARAGCSSWPSRLGPAEKPPKGTGRRTIDDAAARDRAGQDRGRGAGRPRPLEGAAPGRRRPAASPPTCWSTGCGAAARSGTGSGSTCSTSPRSSGRAQEPLEVDYDPWAGRTWPGRRPIRPLDECVGSWKLTVRGYLRSGPRRPGRPDPSADRAGAPRRSGDGRRDRRAGRRQPARGLPAPAGPAGEPARGLHAGRTRHVYRVDPAGVRDLRVWLDGFWDAVLGQFARYAAEDAAKGRPSAQVNRKG